MRHRAFSNFHFDLICVEIDDGIGRGQEAGDDDNGVLHVAVAVVVVQAEK